MAVGVYICDDVVRVPVASFVLFLPIPLSLRSLGSPRILLSTHRRRVLSERSEIECCP